MTTEVRTPFGAPSPIELSSDGLYRKQILRFQTIDYTDKTGAKRKITFDRNYGEDLIRAFREGAYEQVPFQLADNDNRHNNSPLLTGGEVVALALSRDQSGVDAVIKPNDQGRRAIELNSKLGVSARILENATLAGRVFPRAVQHVLGTVDPQVRGMSPWQRVESVDLSSGTVSESLDLSTATYERSVDMPGQNEGGGDTTTLELSTAMKDRLVRLLEEDEGLEALAEQLEAAGIDLNDVEGDDDGGEDEDLEDDHEGATDLSYAGAEAIELSNARLEATEARVIELTSQLQTQRTEAEIAEYGRRGLAPAILELARPLLAVESGAIELSNGIGESVDPGQATRDLLDAVVELSNSGHLMVNPDDPERGSLHGSDADQENRKALLAEWDTYGN